MDPMTLLMIANGAKTLGAGIYNLAAGQNNFNMQINRMQEDYTSTVNKLNTQVDRIGQQYHNLDQQASQARSSSISTAAAAGRSDFGQIDSMISDALSKNTQQINNSLQDIATQRVDMQTQFDRNVSDLTAQKDSQVVSGLSSAFGTVLGTAAGIYGRQESLNNAEAAANNAKQPEAPSVVPGNENAYSDMFSLDKYINAPRLVQTPSVPSSAVSPSVDMSLLPSPFSIPGYAKQRVAYKSSIKAL